MAKIQSISAVLPGDIIQITDPGSPLVLSLMMVEECRRTFTRARLASFAKDGSLEWLEHRVPPGAYERIGAPRVLPTDLAKARETMKQTLEQEAPTP